MAILASVLITMAVGGLFTYGVVRMMDQEYESERRRQLGIIRRVIQLDPQRGVQGLQ